MIMDFVKMTTGLVARAGRGLLKAHPFSGLRRVALSNPARQTRPTCESCGSRVETVAAGLCSPCEDIRKHTHTMTIDLTLPITLLCACCCEVIFSCAKPNGFRYSVKQAILKFHDNDCLCSKCRADAGHATCPECGSQPGYHKPDCSTGYVRFANDKGTTKKRAPERSEPLFIVGDRVRRKDGTLAAGTVRAIRLEYRTPYLVVKWDDDESDLHSETDLVHINGRGPRPGWVGDRVDTPPSGKTNTQSRSHRPTEGLRWSSPTTWLCMCGACTPTDQSTCVKCRKPVPWFCACGRWNSRLDVVCKSCKSPTPWPPFDVGARVRRKDGAPGEGTVTEQSGSGAAQYLVVKWDTADLPQCESHLDLVHIVDAARVKFVVGDRVQRKGGSRGTVRGRCERHLLVKWDDSENAYVDETDITHVYPSTIRGRGEPTKVDPQCDDNDPFVAAESVHPRRFVVGDRVQRKDGPLGRGTISERCSRSRYRTQHFVVNWDSGRLDLHDEAALVHIIVRGDGCDKTVGDKFVVGDRVRRKFGPEGEGTIVEMRRHDKEHWWRCHIVECLVRWDDHGVSDGLWSETSLARC